MVGCGGFKPINKNCEFVANKKPNWIGKKVQNGRLKKKKETETKRGLEMKENDGMVS